MGGSGQSSRFSLPLKSPGGAELRQAVSAVILQVLVFTALGTLNPSIASADACGNEENVFWGAETAPKSGTWQLGHGALGWMLTTARDLNQNCGAYNQAVSTTHEDLGGAVSGNQVETGWAAGCQLVFGVCSGGPDQFQWFTELQLVGNPIIQSHSSTWPCAFAGAGNYMIWSVKNNPSGSTTWALHTNCQDGTGPQLLHSYSSTGYQKGFSETETVRFGGTATGMSDDQKNLNWLDINGNYQTWKAMACSFGDSVNYTSNWKGEKVSANHYDTYRSTTRHCPGPGTV